MLKSRAYRRSLQVVERSFHDRVGLRTLTMSGSRPSPLRAWTVVWVGFVFCSPCISGTRETWMSAKLSIPTRNWNCLIASTNGADSMSPTVPPSLNERSTTRRGQVTGTRYLNYTDISFFACPIHRNLGNTLDPILDCICNVRHNLVGVLARSVFSHSRRGQTCTVLPR